MIPAYGSRFHRCCPLDPGSESIQKSQMSRSSHSAQVAVKCDVATKDAGMHYIRKNGPDSLCSLANGMLKIRVAHSLQLREDESIFTLSSLSFILWCTLCCVLTCCHSAPGISAIAWRAPRRSIRVIFNDHTMAYPVEHRVRGNTKERARAFVPAS